jgi:hypothetical protein
MNNLPEVEWEKCSYCGEEYPKPVSYHHDDQECVANQQRAADRQEGA